MTQADLAAWLAQQTWSDFALSLAEQYQRRGYLSDRQDDAARRMHAKVTARKAKATAPTPALGYYQVDDTYYVVAESKAGNAYAKEWNGYGWDYVGRAPFASLAGVDPLTAEQAAEFGHAFGRCIVCGRTLTDPASVAAGIGPICAQGL